MAAGLLAGSPGRSPRAVAHALRATAAGRLRAEERAWSARIEARRAELVGEVAGSGRADGRELSEAKRAAEAAAALRWMSLPPVFGRLLLRVVRELEPGSCLELGTGFGISAAYQAAGLELAGRGRLRSLDVEDMIRLARPFLGRLDLDSRVELIPGRIEQTLDAAVAAAAPCDYALLDADHREAGTVGAFDAISPALAPGAVVVVDDIGWTEEMRRAWRTIRARPRVERAISLRRLGIAILAEDR